MKLKETQGNSGETQGNCANKATWRRRRRERDDEVKGRGDANEDEWTNGRVN